MVEEYEKKLYTYLRSFTTPTHPLTRTDHFIISHSKKNWARWDQKYILVFMQITRYSCPILMKLESSWHILEK